MTNSVKPPSSSNTGSSPLEPRLPKLLTGFAPADLASDRASLLRGAILDSLAPPSSTDDREAQIGEKYAQTFSWVFDHHFGSWLGEAEGRLGRNDLQVDDEEFNAASRTHGGRVFWINGLPGSGKSTLMRYIHQSIRLGQALQPWTADKPEIASFFFWESGTILQRSQEGVLRSLLAQLLCACPVLIPQVFPALWTLLWNCDTAERVRSLAEWPLDRLMAGLSTYFTLDHPRPSVLLLIDGLDELEGDPQVVLELLQRLSSCERVKICIASRPYSVFEAVFAHDPSLRLQDLTGHDIAAFVRGRLLAHLRYRSLSESEQDHVIRTVQDKAEGVFLWAAVAMDVLAETDDILSQLELLPASLDGLYRYRLLDTCTLPVTLSRMLQLMRARQQVAAFTRVNDMSVMTVREAAIAMENRTLEQLQVMGIEKADHATTAERCRRLASDVVRASHGLLLVQQGKMPLHDREINYKHRTVKDWMVNAQVWRDILELGPSIDAHMMHLATIITLFKSPLERPRRARSINAWWPRIIYCFTHARLSSSPAIYHLLLELDSTLSWYWPRLDKDPRIDSWARSCFGSLESRGRNLFEDPFLALTIRFGVLPFVRQYLHEQRYVPGKGQSLLEHATAFLVHRQSTIYPLSDPRIVLLLLGDADLDVNHCAEPPPPVPGNPTRPKPAKSPWQTVLEAIQQADRRGWIDVRSLEGRASVDRWVDIVRMYVARRPDMGVSVAYSWKDKKENPSELLKRIAEAYAYGPLEQFRLT
ncbi:hypothetical protein HDU86_000056 [Geranomyces michiganensis]|nr:hypothetical protein HDU86_000056 [Geranomyces michiganensis]